MKIYLAGVAAQYKTRIKNSDKFYSLESFYYSNKTKNFEESILQAKDFMLDSGAFTFFSLGKSIEIKWEEYVDRYTDYIRTHNVDLFFELDIDKIVGYEKVVELRKRIEKGVGKQCIPVWHRSRGRENFLRMCDEYPYVAVGGIVSKEISKAEYPIFEYLVNEAHRRKAKIHGLGFTSLKGIQKYHFDSVDSTAWISGNKFGFIWVFNGKTMLKVERKKTHRLKQLNATQSNFDEWLKFQKYAEVYL